MRRVALIILATAQLALVVGLLGVWPAWLGMVGCVVGVMVLAAAVLLSRSRVEAVTTVAVTTAIGSRQFFWLTIHAGRNLHVHDDTANTRWHDE